MRGLNRYTLVLTAVAFCLGAQHDSAEMYTNQYTWADGNTYLYSSDYDSVTVTTYERLDLVLADGSTHLVASLISDVDGNWTGLLDGEAYADQWNEALGDYEVVVGADIWPTWSDFDAALQAIGFWDGAGDYLYDGGGVYYDLGIVYALSSTDSTDGSTATTRTYGTQNAMSRSGGHRSAQARTRLLKNWVAGHGTPTPPAPKGK